jgi:exoribonuclease R
VTGVPSTRVVLPPAVLHDGRLDLDGLRAELAAPGPFPPEALAEAEAAARAPRLPDVDRTDLPLVTIDPPGSMDLDQALHLARAGTGYRLSYAIADVGAFVTAGGALDAEVERRGVTLYAPDGRVPLHPPVLGEQAASLLPDVTRPALLWELDLDGDGVLRGTSVTRALVRSTARLDYAGVQGELDAGTAGRCSSCCARSGDCARSAPWSAAPSTCRPLTRRWCSTVTADPASSCGRSCRSRGGTRRSAC